MGRTGRKRVGSVLILLTEGREQDSYKKALDNYAVMQRKIASGSDFRFQHDLSPRIIPKTVDPQPDKRHIEIPSENMQDGPEPKRPRVKKKAPPKNFFMPEGVKNTGFIKASRVHDRSGGRSRALSTDPPSSHSGDDRNGDDKREEQVVPETLAPQIDVGSEIGLLTEEQEAELGRHYKQVPLWGTEDKADAVVVVEYPNLQAFPDAQRTLTSTKHVPHGECTRRMVITLQRMHRMDDERIERFRDTFDAALLKNPKKKTTAFKPVRPALARNPPKRGRVSRKQKEAEAEAGGDGDVETTEVAPEIIKPNKSRKTIRGTGLHKRSQPAPVASAASTAAAAAIVTVVISDSEGEGGQGGDKAPAKRRRIGGDGDGGEDLPEAKDVLSGFRWAGSRSSALGLGGKPFSRR